MPLIVMAGLPGTGKTTLAKALVQLLTPDAHQQDADHLQSLPVIVNKDQVRAALFHPELIEYSREQDDFCLDIMLRLTGYLFRKMTNRTIILDGRTFSQHDQVEVVEKAAGELGVDVVWIECVCTPETARQRVLSDSSCGSHPAQNRNVGLYDQVSATAEPLAPPHLTVDTEHPLHQCLTEVIQYLATTKKAF